MLLPRNWQSRPMLDPLLVVPSLSKNDADFAVNTIFESLTDAVVAGRRIEIRGFGSFSMKQRQARIRRNPRSGASVAVPARCVVHFKPG